ncbi:MAG: tRNA glutamyl-Q(34) synthetase GluQRS, partial [Gammaproteobacteria bacterium]|nr:tRNA glutamyl-Q(34) synthetase GluQRS [Gammaproteobacteria bacterium]
LQARSHGGSWIIRIDDIDPPREVAGSAASIVRDLAVLGLVADAPVFFQSTRKGDYWLACKKLLESDNAYWCGCSRAEVPAGPYPGTCSEGLPPGKARRSIRLRAPSDNISFHDGVQGAVSVSIKDTCGDFVIWRADELPAYQLAAGMDDAFQKITEVVRGADLLDSTPRQIAVQQALEMQSPAYAHVPVATLNGRKLSKRLNDVAFSEIDPVFLMRAVLEFLGHTPPARLALDQLWRWAITHWKLSGIPAARMREIAEISGPDPLNGIL